MGVVHTSRIIHLPPTPLAAALASLQVCAAGLLLLLRPTHACIRSSCQAFIWASAGSANAAVSVHPSGHVNCTGCMH